MENSKGFFFSLAGSIAFCVIFGSGVLTGWYSGPDRVDDNIILARRDASNSIGDQLLNTIDSQVIDYSLKYLSTNTHVAGSSAQNDITKWVRDRFRAYGLDKYEIRTYNVLLSSISAGHENVVQRLVEDFSEPDGYRVLFQSRLEEPILDENSFAKNITPAFSAFSPSGTVKGDLVYANYARYEDFQHLERNQNINITGTIVIARNGRIYDGDKAKFAAQFGAKGLILFSDPADYNVEGGSLYPDGIFLPKEAVKRGSFLEEIGDPLTPYFPAKEGAYRYPEEYVQRASLPKIPIHPISSEDAAQLLKYLDGTPVQEGWSGNIPDLTYKYGPGFASPEQNGIVRIRTSNINSRKDIWNVIGTIYGEIEPDRFVVVGCHRDAWAFGAADPSSGTAALLEVARAFGKLKLNGWRPRRSIIFASWGAGEFGQIGSNEWVEEYSKILYSSSVAYLNIDLAISGTFVPEFASTPNLYNVIRQAAQKVPDPNPGEFEETVNTVYDRWRLRSELKNGEPIIGDLAAGSDFTPFLHISGVSALDFSFVDKFSEPIEPFPMHHSVYDTYDMIHRLYDPGCAYLQASARLLAEITRLLSDVKVIPFNCNDYASRIDESYKDLRFGEMGIKMINEGGLDFQYMQDVVGDLLTQTQTMDDYILNELDKSDILAVRTINDMLMNFERSFLDPQGLPSRPALRHVIFAPSITNQYACDNFAGIVETMFNIDNNEDPNKWEYVAQQLAAVTHAIETASKSITITWKK